VSSRCLRLERLGHQRWPRGGHLQKKQRPLLPRHLSKPRQAFGGPSGGWQGLLGVRVCSPCLLPFRCSEQMLAPVPLRSDPSPEAPLTRTGDSRPRPLCPYHFISTGQVPDLSTPRFPRPVSPAMCTLIPGSQRVFPLWLEIRM